MALVSASGENAAWSIKTALVDASSSTAWRTATADRPTARGTSRSWPSTSTRPRHQLDPDRRRARAFAAAHNLLELGHRKIGFVSLDARGDGRFGWVDAERIRSCTCKVERDRLTGYAAALAEHGIELDGLPIMEAPNERAGAVRYVDQLLDRVPETTAIVAMSDILALAAIDAVHARGLRVPEDMSVVGFDDIPEAATSDPPLTTVAQPIAEKGRRAARLIFEAHEPRQEILPVELVVRSSTAPPRRGNPPLPPADKANPRDPHRPAQGRIADVAQRRFEREDAKDAKRKKPSSQDAKSGASFSCLSDAGATPFASLALAVTSRPSRISVFKAPVRPERRAW